MSSQVVATRSPIRRAIAGLALTASVAGAGAGAVALEHGAGAHPGKSGAMISQCWYKGWFLEGGTWYYGWFREAC